MSKRYYRYFWGFLKKQENWLNKMASSGYRLVKSGRAWYEFEECEPGKYVYAVEFVGERSKQSAEDYAKFLEDCGYRVIFKNLNLDYSVGKAVYRPWAKKGGKIATTGGTYNKELLVVEKENDGKPFELHTTEEDIREYKKTLRKPFIFFAAAILITLTLVFGINLFPQASGFSSFRSATRIGYVGSEGYSSWSGKYLSLNGMMRKVIHPKTNTLHLDVTTENGIISIEIEDGAGNVIFEQKDVGTKSFDIDVTEKVVVIITADNHKGSFFIE